MAYARRRHPASLPSVLLSFDAYFGGRRFFCCLLCSCNRITYGNLLHSTVPKDYNLSAVYLVQVIRTEYICLLCCCEMRRREGPCGPLGLSHHTYRWIHAWTVAHARQKHLYSVSLASYDPFYCRHIFGGHRLRFHNA